MNKDEVDNNTTGLMRCDSISSKDRSCEAHIKDHVQDAIDAITFKNE
jgi:hypothetical protein